MKAKIILSALVFWGVHAVPLHGQDREEQIISNTARLHQEIVKSELPVKEKYEKLIHLLSRLGNPSIYTVHAEDATQLRNELRSELVSSPGYADYISEKISGYQSRVNKLPKGIVGERADYDTFRHNVFQVVLPQIQTSETIRFLGEKLWDLNDLPNPEIDGDVPRPDANAYLSAHALTRIGLKNGPQKASEFTGGPNNLKLWRSWYEEVKSGKRSFSFEGQNVEYRFNPDGRVSATPIKVQEERLTPTPPKPPVPQQQPTAQGATSTPVSTAQPARWLWMAVGLIVAGMIAAITLWSKGKKSH
jgi:hypothetical protein